MILVNYWQTLVLLVGAYVLLLYVLFPVFIRFTLRQSADPELRPFHIEDPGLPPEVAAQVGQVIEDLEPLGFEAVQGVYLPKSAPRVKAFVFMLAHRPNKDAAFATAVYGQTPQGTLLQTAHLEITTRFRDGALLSTTNSAVIGAFPLRPRQTKTQAPMVREADRLYRLHQAVVNRYDSPASKILRVDEEFQGDFLAYMHHSMVEELDDAAGAGYMYRSPHETVYRPTWKGAFVMTWAQLWPFKAIKRGRVRRRALRLLEELEGNGDNCY